MELKASLRRTVHSGFGRLPGLLHEVRLSPRREEMLPAKIEGRRIRQGTAHPYCDERPQLLASGGTAGRGLGCAEAADGRPVSRHTGRGGLGMAFAVV